MLFPEAPKTFDGLSDEDLAAKLDEFRAAIKHVHENRRDPDVVGDLSIDDVRLAVEEATENALEIKAELETRAAEASKFDADMDALAAKVGVTAEPSDETDPGDETDKTTDEADEPAVEDTPAEQPVAVTASTRSTRRPLPAARRHKPAATDTPDGTGLLASSQVYPYAEPGERLNKRRLSEVLNDLVSKNRIQPGMRVVVASATYPYPAERTLDRDGASNWHKVATVADAMLTESRESLVASGGLCAPLTPIYDLPDIETAGRPVRDALANFAAARGGVIVPTNPTITDYADAVGHVTAAEDEAGGTYAVKTCMRIDCPTFAEKQVDAIYTCIEAGNLTAKAYPELMSRIETLVRANQARLADGFLLDQIKAGSTAVTDVNTTTTAGAMWKLIEYVTVAAAAFRNRHRMADNARLRAIFPEWVLDLLVVDLARNGNDSNRFKTKQQIEDILGAAGVSISYTKDGPATGTAQVFGAQTAGNLLGFPSAVQWALYPEGSWLHLDSGSLDLGVVRDSTLNSTNDFQIFAETWEQAAFVGVESQWHTSTIAPNGTNSAPKDFSAATNF